MNEFETIDIDYNRCQFQYIFEYENDSNFQTVHFRVFSIPANKTRWFLYSFRLIDNHTAKGEMVTNNGYVEFAKKGIPEKIIEIASIVLNRKIISSPIEPQAGDYLVGPSYKAWLRLVEINNRARLNEVDGYFEFNIS